MSSMHPLTVCVHDSKHAETTCAVHTEGHYECMLLYNRHTETVLGRIITYTLVANFL